MSTKEYIFQEILEQETITSMHSSLEAPRWPPYSGRLILTGSGDSYCAALFGQWLMERQGDGRALPALEASRIAKSLQPEDLLVAISASGRTVRVIEAASRALANGARVIAVTDNPESELARVATVTWPIQASPAEELNCTNYQDEDARQYVGYHHDVAQTKTFWATLLTLLRAARVKVDWQQLQGHTRHLLAASFYRPLFRKAPSWAESGQTFILGSGRCKILARFAAYKMFEFNRVAHFNGIEEYCHTHYFITRPGDTVVFLINDQDTAARAAEIVPVLQELFQARIIWLHPRSRGTEPPTWIFRERLDAIDLPTASGPGQQFLSFVLALEWVTYTIGRINAPDINTFHAGYDTERLVAGSLRTIRRSAIRPAKSDQE